MTDTMDVTIRISEIVVSVLPDTHELFDLYAIKVAWHGDDQYAVARLRQCLNRDGQWGFEPRERSDEWIAANRYPYADALRIARRAAVELAIRGRTAAQVLIEEAA